MVQETKTFTSPASGLLFTLDSADGCFDSKAHQQLDKEKSKFLRELLAPKTRFECRLTQDAQTISSRVIAEDGKLDIVVLASQLAAVGYQVSIRTAMGGGPGQECFRNLNYAFLLVSKANERSELIVDPKFRDQFKLSNQTPTYTHLLSFVPDIFVGPFSRLTSLVTLLSMEMETVFSETEITMPPWRQEKSMLSKWNPVKRHDKEIRSPGAHSPVSSGASPRTAWSVCSSPSSDCSDSSPPGRLAPPPLQRQMSTPRKVQTGFCVNPTHAASRQANNLAGFGSNERQPKQACLQCALVAERTRRLISGVSGQSEILDITKQAEHDRNGNGLGLAKIRTVKLGRNHS